MGYRPLATPRSPERLGGRAPPRMPAACATSSWGQGALALMLGSAPPEPIGPARLCPPTLPTGRAWGAGRQRQLGAPSHRSSACGVCTSAPCWLRPLVVSPRPSGAAEVGGVSSGPSQRPPLIRGPCSAPVPGRHGLCPRTHSTVKPWVTRQNRHVHGLPGEPRATAPPWRVRAAACLLPPSRGLVAPRPLPSGHCGLAWGLAGKGWPGPAGRLPGCGHQCRTSSKRKQPILRCPLLGPRPVGPLQPQGPLLLPRPPPEDVPHLLYSVGTPTQVLGRRQAQSCPSAALATP